jgi:hypothetical protein
LPGRGWNHWIFQGCAPAASNLQAEVPGEARLGLLLLCGLVLGPAVTFMAEPVESCHRVRGVLYWRRSKLRLGGAASTVSLPATALMPAETRRGASCAFALGIRRVPAKAFWSCCWFSSSRICSRGSCFLRRACCSCLLRLRCCFYAHRFYTHRGCCTCLLCCAFLHHCCCSCLLTSDGDVHGVP